MFELTIFKYEHFAQFPSDSYKKQIEGEIRKVLTDSFSYSFELPMNSVSDLEKCELGNRELIFAKKTFLSSRYASIKKEGLSKQLQKLGLTTETYLFFLEREKISENKLSFIQEINDINESIENIKQKEEDEIINRLQNISYKLVENTNDRDDLIIKLLQTTQYFDYFEKNKILLPETINHVEFRGSAHNLETKAYEAFKNKDDFSVKVFIPEICKEQQENLYFSIIMSYAMSLNPKLFISSFFLNYLNKRQKEKIKVVDEKKFGRIFQRFDEIKGKKTGFEEYFSIISEINEPFIKELNIKLEEEFKNYLQDREEIVWINNVSN